MDKDMKEKEARETEPQNIQPIAKPIMFSKRELTLETGIPGDMLVSSYYNEERRIDDLSTLDYRRMRDSDGQVQMILNACYNTILSAGFSIEDDDGLSPEEPSEEQQFIEQMFRNPRWKLGMSTPIELINRNWLRAIEEGYRVCEIIYRVDPDGKIRVDRLPSRSMRISDLDIQLIVDDHGNFIGFHQKGSFASKVVDIFVRNDTDIKKAINVVWGREYGSNYGRPALKPVWYHYDKLHKSLYLNHVAHELGANKFKVVYKQGGSNETADQQILDILSRPSQNGAILLNKLMYEIQPQDLSNPEVMAQGLETIQYHTAQMSKAFLAQFIDLGTKITGTGARALGEDQMDFFKIGVQAMAETLLDHNWNEIIADVIKINFNRGIYPKYKTNKINDKSITALLEIFKDLATGGNLTDSVKAQVISKSAENLGLDITLNDIIVEQGQLKSEKQAKDQAELEIQSQRFKQVAENVKLSEMDSMVEPVAINIRPLYLDEQKVKLVDIKYRLDKAQDEANIILTNKLRSEKDELVNKYIEAARKGRKAIKNVKVQLAENETTYSEELATIMLLLIEYGKLLAAGEVGFGIPETSKGTIQAIRDEITNIVEEQSAKLQFRLRNVANDSLDNGIPENDTRLRLEQEFDNFVKTIVTPTVAAVVPKSLNRGRQVVFDKFSDKIFAYRYTAILDNRTTEYCRSLDGRVFQETDPNYALLTPPNHFGCRSVWTPILPSEAAGVQVNGKPFELPTYSSISTFRDTV